MANLALKQLNKVYDNGFKAVNNIDLDIEDKEFIVLVGPSGCGKSTTLRMIAGLEDISGGEISIEDKIVNEIAPKDRDIAMVFQNYALYPHMTVYDNMAFGLKLRKQSKEDIDKRVNEAAEILGITPLLFRKPKELSGGQRQRVALGRAIVREPKVFLMDEPLSNLDAKLRVQMRAELVKLHRRLQTTFIYVTHDQTEAMTMGTRIVVLNNGEIQQVADPKTIYNKPANLFVAGFMGSPQMNFLDGMVVEEEGDICFKFTCSTLKLPKEKADILRSKNMINKEVVLGVRPENIKKVDTTKEIDQINEIGYIEAKVEVSELLGSETYLYLDINCKKLVVRVESTFNPSMGEYIKIYFDMEKIHIFDKESEVALF